MIEKIHDPGLAIYVVWEPILGPDDERRARRATALFPDERVVQYWTPARDVGVAFQGTIGLRTEPAWDVYLVYPPGTTWEAPEPPAPELFMHQLRGRLPGPDLLSAPALEDRLRGVLARHQRPEGAGEGPSGP